MSDEIIEYEEILSQESLLGLTDDFPQIKDACYLDHAGATLYSKSQLDSYTDDLKNSLLGNPHSRNPSSALSTDYVDFVRRRILKHFGTTEDKYSVIFTFGATMSLKTIAENFYFGNGGKFVYPEEAHTSVVGMREQVGAGKCKSNVQIHCLSNEAVCSLVQKGHCAIIPENQEYQESRRNALVVYPPQCNFSGKKLPLSWISKIKKGNLECLHKCKKFYVEKEDLVSEYGAGNMSCNWFVMVDAASFVATSRLDLSAYPADFVAMSFYKMFGFPTGLGALLIKNDSAHVLSKSYFGGGTVDIALASRPFHVKRRSLEDRFEDGTIPFLSIMAVHYGLRAIEKHCSSMETVSLRTFRLAQYFHHSLANMTYCNMSPVAVVYADNSFESVENQGPICTFNLLRPDGGVIGYMEMEQIAYLHNIHIRVGCFCNSGACRRHMNLDVDQVLDQYKAGHVCGDTLDLVDGKPTGAIRVSFGYMSRKEDADRLLNMIFKAWVLPANRVLSTMELGLETPKNGEKETATDMQQKHTLLKIFLYPIKSCAPFEVTSSWPVGERGLLYDREWLIVDSKGSPLNQKKEPRLCQLKPVIDLRKRVLSLTMHNHRGISVPLDAENSHKLGENWDEASLNQEFCTSKVCGDKVKGTDCGDEVAKWLEEVFQNPELRMIQMNASRQSKSTKDKISFANSSQLLLIAEGSLNHLAEVLVETEKDAEVFPNWENKTRSRSEITKEVINALASRFRANVIVSSTIPFNEEDASGFSIGTMIFKSQGPCMRCASVCIDQNTGEKSSEPLLTLSADRHGKPNFGVHLSQVASDDSPQHIPKTLAIGAPVKFL